MSNKYIFALHDYKFYSWISSIRYQLQWDIRGVYEKFKYGLRDIIINYLISKGY